MMGLELASKFCSWLAKKIGPFLRVTKIAKRNMRRTIAANMSNDELDKLIIRLWEHYGRYIAEFVFIDRLSRDELDKRIIIEGMENIADLNNKKKPFLICLAHIGNWDFLIRNITKLYPKFSIIYRKLNNPLINKVIIDTRKQEGIDLIAKGSSGAKDLVKAIKSGNSIAMLVDQKMNNGIEVPFFGMPAMTANAIAKLSLQFDMPIIPVQIIRTKGSNFKAIIHTRLSPQIVGNKNEDSYLIMREINQLIETWIRQNPEQWFWFHNRWKK